MSDKAPDTESYLLSVDDFDKSRLPAHARSPVTAAFKEEVSRLISKDFEGFSGFVRIIVGDAFIEVHYRRDSESTDLVDLAVTRLNSRKYQEGIRLLRMVLSRTPDNLGALGNLGMALSDLGQLDEAERHLRRALKISPESVNVRIALGVALARKDKLDAAITELQRAVLDDPQNAYAHRNLGGCLMKRGDFSTARTLLRRASQLKPDDQQSWFGLAQALAACGDQRGADEALIRLLEVNSRTPIADAAREMRTSLAHQTFREKGGSGPRMDAVMYLLGAIQKFDRMSKAQVQKIAFEIAILGQRGLDMNDSAQKYQLRSLEGEFSGLHLVCLMYAGFKVLDPTLDAGIDLTKEFEVAKAMHDNRSQNT